VCQIDPRRSRSDPLRRAGSPASITWPSVRLRCATQTYFDASDLVLVTDALLARGFGRRIRRIMGAHRARCFKRSRALGQLPIAVSLRPCSSPRQLHSFTYNLVQLFGELGRAGSDRTTRSPWSSPRAETHRASCPCRAHRGSRHPGAALEALTGQVRTRRLSRPPGDRRGVVPRVVRADRLMHGRRASSP